MARNQKSHAFGKGIAMAIPFLLFFVGVFFVSMYFYQSVLEETAFFALIGNGVAAEEDDGGFTPGARPEVLTSIPSIRYGKQFARLNVTWDGGGWAIKDIPVYVGADKSCLKKGAGMSFGSYYPGEGKCTIISAHVTRAFAQLEDTPEGATVLLETLYGPYTYQVVARRDGVKGTDRWYMEPSDDYDLMLYTCYPRDNKGERRTERCVLLCKLIDGVEVQG